MRPHRRVLAATAVIALVVAGAGIASAAAKVPGLVSCNGHYDGSQEPEGPHLDVYPAALLSPDGTKDLNGDGKPDAIESRISSGPSYQLNVRDGASGNTWWSTSGTWYEQAIPMRVGSPARPGLVVIRYCVSDLGAVQFHIEAHDGRTGALVWKWFVTVAHPNYQGVPQLLGVLEAGSNRTGYLSVSGRLIAASDGTARDVCAQQTCFPVYNNDAAPDIDRDGVADLVELDSDGFLRTKSSATLKILWTTSLKPESITRVPDATGDGVRDVLVSVRGAGTSSPFRKGVLYGKTGRAITSFISAAPASALGDATGDGLTDFRAAANPSGDCSCYGADLVGRNGQTGSVLWRAGLPHHGEVAEDGEPRDAGDVNDDGAREALEVTKDSSGVRHYYLVNGRTGAVADGVDLGTPMFASIDGLPGTDFVLLSLTSNAVDVTARDGLTRSVLWTHHRTVPKQSAYIAMHAAQLTADGHADIVVATAADNQSPQRVEVLNGATGQPLWTTTLNP